MRSLLLGLLLLSAVPAVPAVAADLSNVDAFLGETAFDEVQVSPDGSRVAFVSHRNDFEHDREAFTLWRIDLGDRGPEGRAARPIPLLELESGSALRWSPDGRVLSFLSAAHSGDGAQLVVVEPSPEAVAKRVTAPERFPDGVDLYDWLPDGSGFVVEASDPPGDAEAAAQRRQRELYGDVRRLPGPLPTASLSKVSLAGDRVERLAVAPFDVPGALAVSPDGLWLAVAGSGRRETADTNEVALLPLASGSTARAPRRTRNLVLEERLAWLGAQLFTSGMGEEKNGRYTATESRLYRVDTGDLRGDLHLGRVAPALAGSVGEMIPWTDGSLLAVTLVSTGMRISRVDAASGEVRALREQRGWVSNLSAGLRGASGTIAFVAGDAHHFGEVYVARGLDGIATARPVTDLNAALTSAPLPEIETVSWAGDDGTKVEGVLFWPPGRKGERGLPLVVDLHGGPFGVARLEAVDLFGAYTSYPALLAARGFLVLNPNYRGSGGRGDDFTRGIEGHACSRPSMDVVRGVESLLARGWADRARLGLIGYSGGGTLSRCLLGRTDLFRAVVTGAGVWDDISLFGAGRGALWTEAFFEGKTPWEDLEPWWKESPIGSLDKVRTPTLIVAGERDETRAGLQATELYHDLVWRGVPAELLVFPGEGHLFTRPSHKRIKIRSEVAWFEHYLLGKPRAE